MISPVWQKKKKVDELRKERFETGGGQLCTLALTPEEERERDLRPNKNWRNLWRYRCVLKWVSIYTTTTCIPWTSFPLHQSWTISWAFLCRAQSKGSTWAGYTMKYLWVSWKRKQAEKEQLQLQLTSWPNLFSWWCYSLPGLPFQCHYIALWTGQTFSQVKMGKLNRIYWFPSKASVLKKLHILRLSFILESFVWVNTTIQEMAWNVFMQQKFNNQHNSYITKKGINASQNMPSCFQASLVKS